MVTINRLREALKKSSNWHIRDLFEKWSFTQATHGLEMVFWHFVVEAWPFSQQYADKCLSAVRKGRISDLPEPKKALWEALVSLDSQVRERHGLSLVPWLLSPDEPWQKK